jgi:hypothetical protein
MNWRRPPKVSRLVDCIERDPFAPVMNIQIYVGVLAGSSRIDTDNPNSLITMAE